MIGSAGETEFDVAYRLVWEKGAMVDQGNKVKTGGVWKKSGGVVDTISDFIMTK